ncbi:hypothetical protein [Lentilactobacillus sunkii]|uniref:Lipoprotein n=1 Tax=Lentilactobacillus sunkii DSM 19904 TaxID=1423808 RepID=A0A0R1L1I2_9LACO|nr:hypothetical protein [Lentilactobacillus sunkii]KRK86593.1 lipoprotein [Lentilactobacillus sunkii DSM 19904]
MKLYKLGGVLLLSLILVGCGNTNSSKQNSNNESKTDMQNSSSQAQSSSTSQQSASTTSGADGSQSDSQSYDFSSLTKDLSSKLTDTLLPQESGLSNTSKNVHIRYSGNSANSTIYYSLGNDALAVNDASVKSETPYAVLAKRSYSSSTEAQNHLDYTAASEIKGLPKVDLGHSIVGHMQSGAGQEYISWNEGNWSISVHGSPVNNTTPKKLAVSSVNMFENYALPAPNTQGVVKFNVGTSSQVITWQDGSVVYRLKANDPAVAIRMAASMK